MVGHLEIMNKKRILPENRMKHETEKGDIFERQASSGVRSEKTFNPSYKKLLFIYHTDQCSETVT
jgi:hypothetical protein